MAAPFRDLEVDTVGTCGYKARRTGIVIKLGLPQEDRPLSPANCLQHLRQLIQLTGTQHAIDLRHFCQQLPAVSLTEAASDDYGTAAAPLFVIGHFQDGIDGLFLCRSDKPAGIDHNGICLAGCLNYFIAGPP